MENTVSDQGSAVTVDQSLQIPLQGVVLELHYLICRRHEARVFPEIVKTGSHPETSNCSPIDLLLKSLDEGFTRRVRQGGFVQQVYVNVVGAQLP